MGDDRKISDILHSCDGYKKSALSGASPQASALFRKLFRAGILPDLEGLQPRPAGPGDFRPTSGFGQKIPHRVFIQEIMAQLLIGLIRGLTNAPPD
jgi:hypothetical protein